MPSQQKDYDSWEWQEQVIEKIRFWLRNQQISLKDSFKIMDSDFDG